MPGISTGRLSAFGNSPSAASHPKRLRGNSRPHRSDRPRARGRRGKGGSDRRGAVGRSVRSSIGKPDTVEDVTFRFCWERDRNSPGCSVVPSNCEIGPLAIGNLISCDHGNRAPPDGDRRAPGWSKLIVRNAFLSRSPSSIARSTGVCSCPAPSEQDRGRPLPLSPRPAPRRRARLEPLTPRSRTPEPPPPAMRCTPAAKDRFRNRQQPLSFGRRNGCPCPACEGCSRDSTSLDAADCVDHRARRLRASQTTAEKHLGHGLSMLPPSALP
jgi:hypothetical protein